MATTNLRIITPKGVVMDGAVDIVVVRIITGYIGILHNHIPLVSTIVPSEMYYRINGQKTTLHIQGGILQVDKEFVKILADDVESDELHQSRLGKSQNDRPKAKKQ